MVEAARGTENGFGFDALNDAESVVWVNDLVTDLECHISPTKKVEGWGASKVSSPFSIAKHRVSGNEKPAKYGQFFTLWTVRALSFSDAAPARPAVTPEAQRDVKSYAVTVCGRMPEPGIIAT
jgi:hypothetical protein